MPDHRELLKVGSGIDTKVIKERGAEGGDVEEIVLRPQVEYTER